MQSCVNFFLFADDSTNTAPNEIQSLENCFKSVPNLKIALSSFLSCFFVPLNFIMLFVNYFNIKDMRPYIFSPI